MFFVCVCLQEKLGREGRRSGLGARTSTPYSGGASGTGGVLKSASAASLTTMAVTVATRQLQQQQQRVPTAPARENSGAAGGLLSR